MGKETYFLKSEIYREILPADFFRGPSNINQKTYTIHALHVGIVSKISGILFQHNLANIYNEPGYFSAQLETLMFKLPFNPQQFPTPKLVPNLYHSSTKFSISFNLLMCQLVFTTKFKLLASRNILKSSGWFVGGGWWIKVILVFSFGP